MSTYEITPEGLGLNRHPLEAVLGGDAAENAAIITSVLQGKINPYRDIVLANAGACIYVAGLADTMAGGVEKAKEVVDSGKALSKLKQLVVMTEELNYVS
ncbi:Anthranilate phosphoribosyltransferase [compost metagenome]